MHLPALRATTIFLAMMLLITGCGGGGGGGDKGSSASPDTSRATLAGEALKGLLVNATVNVYPLNADGSRGELLGTTRTDGSGRYSITIPTRDAPLEVEVVYGSEATMRCDSLAGCGAATSAQLDSNGNGTTDFGENMPLETDFRLVARLAEATTGTVNATVTPLTHFAASVAERLRGGVDGLSIAMANSQLSNLLRINGDLLGTRGIDLFNDAERQAASLEERRYAILLGAFAAFAQQGRFSELVATTTEQVTSLNGQLPVRSDNTNTVSLLQWARNAKSLADHFGDQALSDAFAQLIGSAELADDDVTDAQPDPGLTSNETEILRTLAADAAELEGILDINAPAAPLPAYASLFEAGEHASEAIGTLGWAGHYGAYVAMPEVALMAGCENIASNLTSFLCKQIVANKTPSEICNLVLASLSINGRSLCEFINELSFPVHDSLTADLALLDGAARLYGDHDGLTLDIAMSNGEVQGNDAILSVDGSAQSGGFALALGDGQVIYHFTDLGNVSAFQMPDSMDIDTGISMQLPEQASQFNGSIDGNVSLADPGNPVTRATLSGDFSDAYGTRHSISLATTLATGYSAVLTAELVAPGSGSTVTLSAGSRSDGSTTTFTLNGRKLNATGLSQQNTMTLDNGGEASIVLNLADGTGTVQYGGRSFGEVVRDGDTWQVRLINGEVLSLQ